MLHGLGGHPATLLPLELFLNFCGYNNTHKISYSVDELSLEECLDYVDKEMLTITKSRTEEVVLIGQSMGGVVSNNMHTKGWNIKLAIYIGSPLHGANLLNQLEKKLPDKVKNYFYKKPYDFLKNKDFEPEPPHPYKTVSMGWFFSDFDGCVYKNETILDPKHHTHLQWADHRTIFANPRLGALVKSLLDNELQRIC